MQQYKKWVLDRPGGQLEEAGAPHSSSEELTKIENSNTAAAAATTTSQVKT
jgi:hypothetical protein